MLAAASIGVAAAADRLPSGRRNFVACPFVQDTDTVPCWLAKSGGETYFLGIHTEAAGWSPPWLEHQVLVEGKLAGGPRICGGVPLTSDEVASPLVSGTANGRPLPNPPVISVMRELDYSCNTVVPADPRFHIVGRRGPGPNTAASAFRKLPAPPPAPVVAPPFKARTFTLHYDFDSELASRTINEALKAVQYARAVQAKHVEIIGRRGATLLSDGQVLQEIPSIARLRAEELRRTIVKLGLPTQTTLEARWEDQAQPADGVMDPQRRTTDVIVTP